MKDDRLYLSNILECIQRIENYTKDGRETFIESTLIQDGVIRNFEVIGEATKRLSEEFRQTHSEIPWKQIAGLRDVLIHDYLKVNLNRIWETIEQNLPVLKAEVINALKSML